jgi:hypothetical protein
MASLAGYGQCAAIFKGRENDHRLQAVDHLDVGDLLEHKLLVGRDIGAYDLEDEIAGTGNVVALDHLADVVDGLDKFIDILFVVAFERDHYKSAHTKTYTPRIDHSMVAFDHARRFELVYPFQRGGRRQADLLGQLGIGDVGIGLKDFKDLAIGSIELDVAFHF